MALPEPVLSEQPRGGALVDRFGRKHTYVRVSVTDRCNYRCVYCLPAEGTEWMPREHLLTYEEITRIVRALARMGVTGVRLTGGEPLIRHGLVELVRQLSDIDGIDDIAMTTNGHRLARHAVALAEAGLTRVNVSIDTLDAGHFAAITRGGDLKRVLEGIDAAVASGLTPVKLNCVVVKGDNEASVVDLVEYASRWPDKVVVRFIEKMPFRDEPWAVVPSEVLRERLAEHYTLRPVARRIGQGPADTWIVEETGQHVGFISPMTQHFCQACNRVRLQANGDLRTCLSRDDSPNLRDALRDGIDDDALEVMLRKMVWLKVAGHEAHTGVRSFQGVMTQIGG